MSEANQDIEKLTFEQAYQQLQDTVQRLETGNLPLAESIALYQWGMALAERCGTQLDQAELTIKSLLPSGDLVDLDEL